MGLNNSSLYITVEPDVLLRFKFCVDDDDGDDDDDDDDDNNNNNRVHRSY